MARHHDAIRRKIGREAPGVLAGSRRDLSGIVGRPTYRRGFPHLGAQFLGEVQVRLGVAGGREKVESAGAQIGERSVALALQFLVQAAADHRPVAQVVGDRPDELYIAPTELRHLARGRGQEVVGRTAGRSRQHHQELAASAGAEQNSGETRVPPAAPGEALRTTRQSTVTGRRVNLRRRSARNVLPRARPPGTPRCLEFYLAAGSVRTFEPDRP